MFKGIELAPGIFKAVNAVARYSGNGKLFLTFSVPVKAEEKDGGDITCWMNCVAFGKTAEFLNEKLAPQGRVYIKKWILQSEDGLPPMYNEKPQWKATVVAADVIDWATEYEATDEADPTADDEEEFPF